jgi:taurine transport system permease protein
VEERKDDMQANKPGAGSTGLRAWLFRHRYTFLSILGVVIFIVIWDLLLRFNIIPSKYLSRPGEVVQTFIMKLTDPRPEGATLLKNISSSLQVALSGFILAVIIGVPLGLAMGWFNTIDKLVRPVFEVLRPIPPVAWIPLTILWLGIGLKAKAFIIFFAAFIPCVINSYAGIKLTSKAHINVAKTCGASSFRIFLSVGVPSAIPMVLTGMRIALGAAWATLVAAEMLAANSGLGFMIGMGRSFARPDLIIMGMLVIGIIGAILAVFLSLIERKLTGWRMR